MMKIDYRCFLLYALAVSMATAQTLTDLTNNMGQRAYGLCQGDCDRDSDCDFGLNCLQRGGTETVPGCAGSGTSGNDYCYIPPSGSLVIAGDEEEPVGAFPLQACQGDCDFDSDCQGLLMCSQRSGTEAVPGCTGSGQSGKDYCYDAGATVTTLQLMGNNGSPAAQFPLGKCHGDCDSDSDCAGEMLCFQRGALEPVPGCDGEGSSGWDYCYLPSLPLTDLTNNLGQRAYARCQGDCDSDSDCAFGLGCFQRSGTETVPDCDGAGSSGTDYCYLPPAGSLIIAGDEEEPVGAFPLQACQGDCDFDSDCQGLLMCSQRSGTEAVPGCTGSGQSGKDYCYDAGATVTTLQLMGDNGSPAAQFPLGKCHGDCDSDSDCAGSLICFQRGALEPVPGCDGEGSSGSDYCYDPAPPVSSPTNAPVTPAPVPSPTNAPVTPAPVPSPTNAPVTPAPVPSPTNAPVTPSPVPSPMLSLQDLGNNGAPAGVFPLIECAGDCDNDGECAGDLKCFQRSGLQPVPGCNGSGSSGTDYCYSHYTGYGTLTIAGDNGSPASAFPLQVCQGDCDSDDECGPGLYCYQRGSDSTFVPGCVGSPDGAKDYCINPNKITGPTPAPVPAPTFAPVDPTPTPPGVTYRPGDKTVLMEGLSLSTGLTARKIATKNLPVQYDIGGQSTDVFHTAPDGAAIFEDKVTGEYVYASNSESSTDGGVGSIRFNAQGQVIGYQRLKFRDPVTGVASTTKTSRNCGVGKTYWNTLMTCEEKSDGGVWEVDPWGNEPGRKTQMVAQGRAYESAAYDNRNVNNPVFYITTDETTGPLVQYTPAPSVVATAITTGNYSQVLHSAGGTYRYFKIDSITQNSDGTATGSYSWTTDVQQGNDSAGTYHKNGEGIDIRGNQLYYTTKTDKLLWIIDLDSNNFSRSSTVSGAFDSQPDQVARVLDFGNGSTDGILYFCEDGGDECGVHGRDAQGRFFTILEDGTGAFSGETTGLAFSPNGMFMYVSFQSPGIIFEISRTDGFPFYGATLDIKYHADGGPNAFRDRMLFEDNAKTCETNTEMCVQ